MDPKTEEALDASITHWEEVCAMPIVGDVDLGVGACALCSRFHTGNNHDDCCSGCPVHLATGSKSCRGSPYFDAYDAYKEWRQAQFELNEIEHRGNQEDYLQRVNTWVAGLSILHVAFIEHAKKELAFLRSLKPLQPGQVTVDAKNVTRWYRITANDGKEWSVCHAESGYLVEMKPANGKKVTRVMMSQEGFRNLLACKEAADKADTPAVQVVDRPADKVFEEWRGY